MGRHTGISKGQTSQLCRIVSGILRSTIDAHGDITKEWVGSAAKRIVNQLIAEGIIATEEDDIKTKRSLALLELARLHQEVGGYDL